jgi:hypothetical protein
MSRYRTIRPDPLRETILAKEPLEDLLCGHQRGAGEATAAEEIAGEHVLSGEGVAEHAVAQAELALVIDGPDGIGLLGQGPWPTGVPATHTSAAWLNETLPIDDVVDGGPGGQRELGPVVFEEPADLLGPVVGIGFADLKDRLSDVRRCGPGAAPRRAASILEPGAAVLLEALEPLVAGLAADAEAAAGLGEAPQTQLELVDEALAFVHDTGFLEWHRPSPLELAD